MSPYADVTIRVEPSEVERGIQYADAALLGSRGSPTAVVVDAAGRVLARFSRGRWKRAATAGKGRGA